MILWQEKKKCVDCFGFHGRTYFGIWLDIVNLNVDVPNRNKGGGEKLVLQDYDGACLDVSKVNMALREPAVMCYLF